MNTEITNRRPNKHKLLADRKHKIRKEATPQFKAQQEKKALEQSKPEFVWPEL